MTVPPRRARNTDPSTSHAAARRAEALAGEHASRIAYALTYGGPATAHELADRCRGMTQVQIARRLPEMEAAGAIRRSVVYTDTDQQVNLTRPGPSGRECIVWEWAG